MTDVRVAVRHGVISRSLTCFLYILFDALLPDHEPFGVDFAPVQVPSVLRAFTRWDAAHFLRISKYGYQEDKDYAFFPLFPLLVRLAARAMHMLLGLSEDTCLVVAGVALSNLAFVAACVAMQWYLSQQKAVSPAIRRTALLLFCYNPASVFFSGIYTESLYSMLSFPIVALTAATAQAPGVLNVFVTVLGLCSGFVRSNGFLNAIFPAVRAGKAVLLALMSRERVPTRLLATVARDLLWCVLFFVPYVLINWKGYRQFCVDIPVGQEPPEWCASGLFPSIYSYIQLKYWNVGFLRYYQLKQIPNFALASPILYISAVTIYRRVRLMLHVPDKKHDDKSHRQHMPFQAQLLQIVNHPDLASVCHLFILTAIAILVVNIQISTRLLISSSPLITLGFAELWHGSSQRMRRILLVYVVGYIVVGTALHANFFPWT